MKNLSTTLFIFFFIVVGTMKVSAAGGGDAKLLGFKDERVADQKALETKFDTYLSADDLRARLKILSARPHHVGSPYDKQNAEFILSQYKSWGFDAAIEQFKVLFPTPKERVLELVAPESFTCKLTEPALAEDSTSNQTSEQLPTYNAYSIDGDVTGELVYVNYGTPKDYEELAKYGIDVKGKIVISRYGGAWRGIKPKVAGEHGAIGCIIYSDPRNDGYYEGDVYPKGAYRSDEGVQRGSVADMPIYPGDPLTPGVGATEDAKRLDIKDAQTLTKIPVLPISYADALPLLRNLTGPVAPEEWRGALPITYHLGPGASKVHLKLAFNWDLKPVYDVIAKIKGSERPDEWIIRGNHHDGWVNGADDPLSGQIATMEEGKAIGALLKTGWKPKRTIVYCAWDGEEPGLLGSTEWVETHADVLKHNGAVYINSDSNGRGYLGAGGSHTLEPFVNQVAKDVIDPEKHISVLERDQDSRIANSSGEDRKENQNKKEMSLYALGSGSDYTPFLQHLGLASLDIGYGGEDGGGSYHSIYDSYDHYVRFGDPNFAYGVAMAQTGGRIVLRLADADVLPVNFESFTTTVDKYAKEVQKLADNMRTETEEENKLIKDHVYEMASDPTQVHVVPAPKDPVPFINFAPLQNALAALHAASDKFRDAASSVNPSSLSADKAAALDQAFMAADRALTAEIGLPGRPWFKNFVYAPGKYTGYGVKTLPGIREAIEQRKWKEAEDEIGITAGVINGYAQAVSTAADLLK